MNKHEVICFGEALWDLLPIAEMPGGAPMNVTYHLKKLGLNPALITRIGIDKFGEGLVNMLATHEVCTDLFYADNAYPTGLVHVKMDDHHEVVYDIAFPAAWDFIEWKDEFAGLIKNAGYFVFGSLASRNKISRDTLHRCLDAGSTNVMDINLRPPHFNRNSIEHLLRKADILKMNLEELELVTGWFSHFKHKEDRMKLIQERFGIGQLLVTMGAKGSILSDNGEFYYQQAHKVVVQDTIGSGDSFLAAFLQSSLTGSSPHQALAFASAVGAFVASKAGACPDYDITTITALVSASTQPISTESFFNQ
jgi:fructokinase